MKANLYLTKQNVLVAAYALIDREVLREVRKLPSGIIPSA